MHLFLFASWMSGYPLHLCRPDLRMVSETNNCAVCRCDDLTNLVLMLAALLGCLAFVARTMGAMCESALRQRKVAYDELKPRPAIGTIGLDTAARRPTPDKIRRGA
jgi:hypothetical protein